MRARLAQREQRLAELSATLAALYSREAEERHIFLSSADEQSREMLDASQNAEPFLRRGSDEDAVSFPGAQAAAVGSPVAHDAVGQSMLNREGGKISETPAIGMRAIPEQEVMQGRNTEASAAAEPAPDGGHAAVSCSKPEPAPAAPGASTLQLPGNEGLWGGAERLPEPASVDSARPPLAASSSSSRAGASARMLQLAEEAEDARLELAQRTAEARGLQARLEHLTACQADHEQAHASQAALLASRAEVSGPHISYACLPCLGRQQAEVP